MTQAEWLALREEIEQEERMTASGSEEDAAPTGAARSFASRLTRGFALLRQGDDSYADR